MMETMDNLLVFGLVGFVFQFFGALALFATAAEDKVTDE